MHEIEREKEKIEKNDYTVHAKESWENIVDEHAIAIHIHTDADQASGKRRILHPVESQLPNSTKRFYVSSARSGFVTFAISL